MEGEPFQDQGVYDVPVGGRNFRVFVEADEDGQYHAEGEGVKVIGDTKDDVLAEFRKEAAQRLLAPFAATEGH